MRAAAALWACTAHGHFAEYARVDTRTAARLPDQLGFETAAPLACAGVTVYRGVVLSGVEKGEWLAMTGSGGGLGHLGVQFAKALGLNVIGIDARDEGLELTRQGGADVIIDARKGYDEVVRQVHAVTNGEGVPCTLNLSDAPSAMKTACAITKMHGTVIQIAQVPSPPSPNILNLDSSLNHSSPTTSSSPSRISSSATSASEARSSLHPARRARC